MNCSTSDRSSKIGLQQRTNSEFDENKHSLLESNRESKLFPHSFLQHSIPNGIVKREIPFDGDDGDGDDSHDDGDDGDRDDCPHPKKRPRPRKRHHPRHLPFRPNANLLVFKNNQPRVCSTGNTVLNPACLKYPTCPRQAL